MVIDIIKGKCELCRKEDIYVRPATNGTYCRDCWNIIRLEALDVMLDYMDFYSQKED